MTAGDPSAWPFDTNTLMDGHHALEACIVLDSAETVMAMASFVVTNSGERLVANPPVLTFTLNPWQQQSTLVEVLKILGPSVSFTEVETATWLDVTALDSVTPMMPTFSVDSSGVAPETTLQEDVAVSATGLDNKLSADPGQTFSDIISVTSSDEATASLTLTPTFPGCQL